MNTDPKNVLVFKTNIRTETDTQIVKELLSAKDQIIQWSIDTEDKDCVLRVVSSHLAADHIIELINKKGYQCHELV